jgi:sulfatase maturation enzyme AslB (radical SAM superfamily)
MSAISAPPRAKFSDPALTARGEPRATVALDGLRTLWFNTGTLCNITCAGCYIESSPRNDRLSYLTRAEAASYLAEAAALHPELVEIGFTGGEPFMNPDMPGMMEDALAAGHRVLVLTNAMRPMQRFKPALLALQQRFPGRLTIRVSLDHYRQREHEALRGVGSWQPAIDGVTWLGRHGFDVAIAGRTVWHEGDVGMRAGFEALFGQIGLSADTALVLFPEMDEAAEVPEITTACWGILHKSPRDVMCASARMVVKRRGAAHPAVVACTLLPYDEAFELGGTLAEAGVSIALNHPHCAKFCVLGGASCSG